MSVIVSKGRLFRVTIAVDDERLAAMKKAPELALAALQAGADYWHSKMLPKHFQSGAHQKYGYANRSIQYLKQQRKTGKPDMVMSGSLRNDLVARAQFKQGAAFVELKMTSRVLNFVPNMAQDNQDLYVKQKGGKSYPNMKREIKILLDDEREAIAAVVTDALEKSFGPAGQQLYGPTP